MALISLFGPEAQAIVKPIIVKVKTNLSVKTPRKSRSEDKKSITDLQREQQKSMDRIKEYETQDESGFSESDKCVKGKDVNIRLLKNHILYYQKEIEKLQEPFNPLLNK